MIVRAARNQNHIRVWWAGVLTNCGDRVETVQCVSKNEPLLRQIADVRAIPDVGGYPTYYDVVVTSPLTTGMRESQESEPKEQPHREREKKDWKPPPETLAIHIVPLAFDVCGRRCEKKKKGAALKQEAQ